MSRRHVGWVLLFGGMLLVMGCQPTKQKKTNVIESYIVKTEVKSQNLYFTGEIKPLSESAVSVSTNAVVKELYFNYGQRVVKGDKLALLHSPDQKKEFDDTLTAYLKAKDSLSNAEVKFTGTESLWKSGLISDNSYKADQSSLLSNRISFLQAKEKLIQLLHTHQYQPETIKGIMDLSLEHFDEVQSVLTKNHSVIQLFAPKSGVALQPPATGSDNKEALRVGGQVKQSDVITLIGDITGYSIVIKIPEVNIEKVKPGMKAKVSGIAFPNIELGAFVERVNAQANNAQGSGGLPVFTANIIVPSVSEAQRKIIKVGMSATVSVTLQKQARKMIPIAAVFSKGGHTWVKVRSANGKAVEKRVETGMSTSQQVQVLKGLKNGDVIVWQKKGE